MADEQNREFCELLERIGIFFEPDEEDHMPPRMIDLNDSMFWACADGEKVEDSELPRVWELFYRYGWCGILYWVVREKRQWTEPVEFLDVQRFIEFVDNEERIRREVPGDSDRAYSRQVYTLGEPTAAAGPQEENDDGTH